MKRITFILIGILLITFTWAQKQPNTISFSISGNRTADYDFQKSEPGFGFSGDVKYNHFLTRHIGLNAGLSYTRMNAYFYPEFSLLVPWEPGNHHKTTNEYIEIPLNLTVHLRFEDQSRVNPYFIIGYSFAQLIRSKWHELNEETEQDWDLQNESKSYH